MSLSSWIRRLPACCHVVLITIAHTATLACAMKRAWAQALYCCSCVLWARSDAFVVSLRHRQYYSLRGETSSVPRRSNCAASRRPRHRSLRMDDEIARKGIKEELTTRDAYLATRFTKLSASGHDLTPLTPLETQEAASHLPPEQAAVLFGRADKSGSAAPRRAFLTHSEKGLYACSVGGLPLFTSGWKLEPREEDERPSFAEPCDEEHLVEEFDAGNGVTTVSCARSRLRVGVVVADELSPSGKRYVVSGAALEFHPLGKALPVRCQPENYWGSEGQYRAWVLE